MSKEEFAELAFEQQDNWDEEQLDILQSLVAGEEVDADAEEGLLQDYIYHTPQQPTPHSPPAKKRSIPRELMDPEEIAEEDAPTLTTAQSLRPLEVPSANVDLDDWLKKKTESFS